jgi:hypothetical protein
MVKALLACLAVQARELDLSLIVHADDPGGL